ncbi:hypothetical protein BGX27_002618, partial [Mortierella sp. AM989]
MPIVEKGVHGVGHTLQKVPGIKQSVSFFADYRKFMDRGNVVDLAVAVVVGTAFTAIVTSLVTDVITPIIALASGKNLQENFVILRKNHNATALAAGTPKTRQQAQSLGDITWNWGNFIQTVINFFITSGCVFLIVKGRSILLVILIDWLTRMTLWVMLKDKTTNCIVIFCLYSWLKVYEVARNKKKEINEKNCEYCFKSIPIKALRCPNCTTWIDWNECTRVKNLEREAEAIPGVEPTETQLHKLVYPVLEQEVKAKTTRYHMAPQSKVLITGASFGGVMLAILLERAGINYELFESAPSVQSFGSAVILGPTVMPLLEQLGLLDKVQAISKKLKTMHLVEDNMHRIGEIDLSIHKHQTGYDSLVATRSDLLTLFVSHIPANKIRFSKRVVAFTANKDSVVIRCSDDSTFKGEILVGADGAFSKIRELLYRQLTKKGILSRNDAAAVAVDAAVALATGHGQQTDAAEGELLHAGHVSLVGVTGPLDIDLFPVLKETDSRCNTVISDQSHHSWSYFTVPGNRICWAINVQLGDATLREHRAQSPETLSADPPRSPPSPTPSSISSFSTVSATPSMSETNATDLGWELEVSSINPIGNGLLEECRSFQAPMLGGKTFGDLIDATPVENIARAITEQTLFETWHHGRTVLIGDACHRMLSNAAHQGAVNSIQDAVVLANLIQDLPSASAKNLVGLFKDYQAERHPHAKAQMHVNDKVSKLISGN